VPESVRQFQQSDTTTQSLGVQIHPRTASAAYVRPKGLAA
jgi:hypothetical protein